MKFFALILATSLTLAPKAAELWQEVLAKCPVPTNSFRAYQTAPVSLILNSFKPQGDVRGIILMPGAADQLYFFDWGKSILRRPVSVLDVINVLTNRPQLTVTFVKPFVLICHKPDVTSDPLTATPDSDLEALGKTKIPGRSYFLDRPYDRILPDVEKILGRKLIPTQSDTKSWHYYRLSFVGYDLTGSEFLRAMAYGMKTVVEVQKGQIVFKDRRSQPQSSAP